MIRSIIVFKVNNKGVKSDKAFEIKHTMDKLDLDVAIHSWLHRTDSFSERDLQDYLKSKGEVCKVKPYNF